VTTAPTLVLITNDILDLPILVFFSNLLLHELVRFPFLDYKYLTS
jgi:hypothetical protein